MKTELEGKTAIVTGAASGIGLATAEALASEGARVVAVDVDSDALEVFTRKPSFRAVHADVSVASNAGRVASNAIEFGKGSIDVLVNDAGVGFARTLTETTDDEWEQTFAVNARGPFLMCRAVIPHMVAAGGGVIVNVASAAAVRVVPSRAAYCASKAAVIALTKAITIDYATKGIRANAVAPGVVDTPWVDRVIANADDPLAQRAQMAARQLVGRLASSSEIADAIVFLASERSTFMHGSTLVVDGGFTVG